VPQSPWHAADRGNQKAADPTPRPRQRPDHPIRQARPGTQATRATHPDPSDQEAGPGPETRERISRRARPDGYDVEQNPPPKPNGKEPDYRIQGEYFDNYAPATDNLDNIRTKLSKKVSDDQADHLVLNLDDTSRSMDDIADMLRRKPIADLKQILVVQDGKVIPFFPFEG
jgi:hypothetical protein